MSVSKCNTCGAAIGGTNYNLERENVLDAEYAVVFAYSVIIV